MIKYSPLDKNARPMKENAPSTYDLSLDLATLKTEIRGDIKNLSNSVEEVKDGLLKLGEFRAELARFGIHHEQFRNEAQTMWKRIDESRAEIEGITAQLENWKGRVQMAGAVFTVMAAVTGGVITWSWLTVQSVPLLAERINSLEQRAKFISEKLVEQLKPKD